MLSKNLSLKEILKFGFYQWKKQWLLLTLIWLFSIILPVIPTFLQVRLSPHSFFISALLGLVHFIFTLIATIGCTTISIKAANEEKYTFIDFFSTVHLVPTYLAGIILYIIIICIGSIFLIIPGIYLAIRLSFYAYFILDRNFTISKAFTASYKTTAGYTWQLFLFIIAALLLNFLATLLFIVGLVIISPITLIAWAKIYLLLSNQEKEIILT